MFITETDKRIVTRLVDQLTDEWKTSAEVGAGIGVKPAWAARYLWKAHYLGLAEMTYRGYKSNKTCTSNSRLRVYWKRKSQ